MDAFLSTIISETSSDICDLIGLNTQRHHEIYEILKPRFNEFNELAIQKINKVKLSPDCCDESKQDLRDWIECGFKFCPWCGRELRPIA